MRDYQSIKNTSYEAIIIGGGINGAGVARDAALRGLKTILIEKNDFASGSSSWSTRLVHGGLRYLEYFELPLVRESLKEREILLNIAPHLVKPLLLTVPVYGDRSRPYWKIWAGMILYDLFSFDKTLPGYRMLNKAKFKRIFPTLDPENLSGGAQYYDARVAHAERLCLENIISAKEAGADVLNYVKVTRLHLEGKKITHLTCKDTLTGEEFTVKGTEDAVIVNTSGPWVDEVCGSIEIEATKADSSKAIVHGKKMGPTKGSHIVVDPFPGAPESGLYVEAKSDGRPFFILPWLGKYLIGTTDFPYHKDLESIKADNDEIDYLLTETNNILPTANLSRQDIKFTYSGVRPLPNEAGKKAGSITRSHILFDGKKEGVFNLISLIGGKLTTYRQVGEEIVDAILKKQGKPISSSKTALQPLPGAIKASNPLIQKTIDLYRDKVSLNIIAHLFSLYGARAVSVLELTEENPELAETIHPELPDIKAQLVYGVRVEFALSLVDLIRRRTAIAMEANYGLDVLTTSIEVLQKYCNWSAERCELARSEYITYMKNNCIPDFELEANLI
ncbi:MAG: glycerol-3-phosphate dehydrogenase [Prochloraceae cyanobacterium]|nr:glycerol-3-phosphate dehydrogenase [Prochloraceae cyanobacterium]